MRVEAWRRMCGARLAAASLPLVALLAALVVWPSGAARAGAHRGRLGGPDEGVVLTMRTPHSGFNRMVVSVTVCAPGTKRCATIDDVMVDTGSTGLRLEAAAVPKGLRLPAVLGPTARPLAECLRFVADVAWGGLYRADIRLGGSIARDLPLQLIGEDTRPRPDGCPRSDVRPTSNGTLGIGPHLDDCAGPCAQDPAHPGVFECSPGACTPVQGRVAPPYRLPNPVAAFPGRDNGVVFDLPPPPRAGTAEVVGRMILGVGTDRRNQLGPARILRLGPAGRFTTLFGGRRYPESYIDSGTETYILADDRLPRCKDMDWAYCVSPEASRAAVMVGADGVRVAMSFRVGDYRAIRDHRFGASDSIAVAADPASRAFVWGAPFFLGKRVGVVLDGRSVPGAPGLTGPLYAIGPGPPPSAAARRPHQ